MRSMRVFALWFCLVGLAAALFSGCGKEQSEEVQQTEVTVVDAVGRSVVLPYPVTRAAVANRYNMEVIQSIGALDCVCGVDYGIYQDRDAYGGFSEDQVIWTNQGELNYERIIELHPEVLIY